MSSTPQDVSGVQPLPQNESRQRVITDLIDFIGVLYFSIDGELYKIRHRSMPKVLLIIGIIIIILGFIIVAIPSILVVVSPPQIFLCQPDDSVCQTSTLTQQDQARAEQVRKDTLATAAQPLHLPASLVTATNIVNFIGLLLLIILAGVIVGGEYGTGTIRLILTRGPTRTQFFLAKLGTILISTIITFLLLTLIGIVMGTLLALVIPGITVNFSFFTSTWILHALIYLFAATLGLLVYAMIAFFLATLGKATAAGIAGALVWWMLEGVLSGVFSTIGALSKGQLASILKIVPDYFIGNNISALLRNQEYQLIGSPPSAISDLHAASVITGYLTIFLCITWMLHIYRDVAN